MKRDWTSQTAILLVGVILVVVNLIGLNLFGRLDLTDDAVYSLSHLFQDGPVACRDAIDVNDDGELDIADPVYLLLNLFAGGAAIPEPVDWCGEDPTLDAIDCATNQTCDLGGPIEGLTEAELISFNRGREVMRRRFEPEEGLGPFYNTTSCVACHETPVTGDW